MPELDFSLTPEALTLKGRAALDAAKERVDALVASKDRSFAATFEELDRIDADLEEGTTAALFLAHCSPNRDVRDAASAAETEAGKFHIDLSMREDVYAMLKAVSGAGLTPVQARLRDKTLLSFRRAGLELEPLDRARFKLLSKQLLELQIRFSKNLSEVKDFLPVTRSELAGLPEDYIARLERTQDGLYKVTLDYPDSLPFMANASSGAARRRLHELMYQRGVPDNVALLEEILSMRRRLAKLLGLPSYAHYVLEERMARTPDAVMGFLGRLRKRLSERAVSERQRLLELKRAEEPQAARLEPWDVAYYHDRLLRSAYAVDEDAVAEYFPAEKVAAGMLELYEGLLGLRFTRLEGAKAWHPEVRAYTVEDAGSGAELGRFYLDLYPRDGKFKHAAVFPLIHGRREADGSLRRPAGAMLVNFPRPAGGKPSLLKHGQVETFFHEFGHVMHGLLSEAPYGRFSGTRVARDFVEAPSQIMENWVWDKAVLKGLSGHWHSGEPLPDALIDRMLAAQRLNTAVFTLRQLAFALIDQALHGSDAVELQGTYSRIYEEVTTFPTAPDTRPEASFGHLMSYAASYYGYLWSDVYSADMFSVFSAEGDVRSARVGARYRNTVLAPGGSRDEGDIVRDFLGREPREDSFLAKLGV
ncbi:MAG: Zn-dependent oligopeptidase [Elusimicrobia bacterium]|nr:Zn-dependent oligopeptidase [Elusimicrobiota bacterium]